MLHLSSNAVTPQKREAMTRQASSHGTTKPGNWRGRRRLRVRAGVRLGLLLRLRVRLSGVVGLLLRSFEELRCCPGGASRWWRPRARGPPLCHSVHGRRTAPAARDQSSFYAEAIADCLEFIKSRSSYCPVKDGRDC